jgi:hypothetical protein
MISMFKKRNPLFSESVKRLKEEGFDVKIWDEDKIEKNYGKRTHWALEEVSRLILNANFKRFLIIFDQKKKDTSWYSENTDRVVINLAFYPGTPRFNETVKEAAEEALRVEELLAEISS